MNRPTGIKLLTHYCDRDIADAFKLQCAIEGVSMSQRITEFVKAYLAENNDYRAVFCETDNDDSTEEVCNG